MDSKDGREAGPWKISERNASIELIRHSGLFDDEWYRAHYKTKDNETPIEEWFDWAWKMGRSPNLYFQPHWYLAHYPDVAAYGINPLVHYIQHGDRENRTFSELFSPAWYRATYKPGAEETCLAHYLRLSRTGTVSPIPDFDADFYLAKYHDVAEANLDPFGHFAETGFKEDRDPSTKFDTAFYRRRYLPYQPDVNPLIDFRRKLARHVIVPCRPLHESTIPVEMRRFTRPGQHFEEFRPIPPEVPRRARVLAYYLPQFHAIRENDNWWGKGFTEWTNLMRGLPRFSGHYQPRTPRDLGFYDLNEPHTMLRQIKMAKDAGIGGFVFYFYWFNGKRLLDAPIERFLEDSSLDMPFCLMWANENWTKKWDGLESEVLIRQDYATSDDEALIECFGRHFKDRRYIRIQNRPLLMIYRPNAIPNAVETIARWRLLFRRICLEDPILVMAQGFGTNDPGDFGLDGAVEFPPHKICVELPSIAAELHWLDPDAEERVVRFEDAVRASLSEPVSPFPLIKTAFPGWDNDARREGQGMVVHGATPSTFQTWLSALIDRAQETSFFGQAIVCINAWNEWAEGAYLEPDVYFGAAFLNAVGRAVSGERFPDQRSRLLLVGDSAHFGDTQALVLALGRRLRAVHGLAVEFLLLEGGPMIADYSAEAPTAVLSDKRDIQRQIAVIAARGIKKAIVNTIAAGKICGVLAEHGISTTLLAYDLPDLIRERNLADVMRLVTEPVSQMIFSSSFLEDYFINMVSARSYDLGNSAVLPQCLHHPVTHDAEARASHRRKLGVPEHARLLLGVGYGDIRNGFDLFLQVWRASQNQTIAVHCVWFGDLDRHLMNYLLPDLHAALDVGTLHIIDSHNDIRALLSAADVLLLTARDDPLPSVVLQAAAIGLPSVAFIGAGGAAEFIVTHGVGEVVAIADVHAMAQAAARVWGDETERGQLCRMHSAELFNSQHVFDNYVNTLMDLADPVALRTSVVVLNHNCALHLPQCLHDIFNQNAPVREVILIDYASSDGSIDVALATAETKRRCIRHTTSKEIYGAVIRQWKEAAEMATGTYLWITEGHHGSDAQFLEKATTVLESDPSIVMVFTNSVLIDDNNTVVGPTYMGKYDLTVPGLLAADGIFEGQEFIARCVTRQTVIYNLSAVVWRRSALLDALTRCEAELSVLDSVTDQSVYAYIAAQSNARIAYFAAPLNRHRRAPAVQLS